MGRFFGAHPRGAPIIRKFAFAYNSTGLTAGRTFYTPRDGDLLLDAWIEVLIAWNGTTPFADIGSFVGTNDGLYTANGIGAVDLAIANAAPVGEAGLRYESLAAASHIPLSRAPDQAGSDYRLLPATFVDSATHPLKVVVSQTGLKNGASPGSTQGSAILYLVTTTPV